MPRFIDMTGQKFERLTVVSLVKMTDQGAHWKCLCDCGTEVVVARGNLTTGNSKSCGCRSREVAGARFRTHGATHTPEYQSWASMLQRCTNPNEKNYHNYGGRGITVCDQWAKSFDLFLADMGKRPTPKHSIDRRDNNGPYDPSNCRWATDAEQMRNTRRNRYIDTPAGRMLLEDAASHSPVTAATLWKRLRRGWTPEQLFLPPGTYIAGRKENLSTKDTE